MTLLAVALAALGMATLISKRQLLGVLSGIILLFWSAAVFLMSSAGEEPLEGTAQVYVIFILAFAVPVLAMGAALVLRIFYLRSQAGSDEEIGMNTLRQLRH